MQSKMQSDMNNFQNAQKTAQPEPRQEKEGDYIEFEEVKK